MAEPVEAKRARIQARSEIWPLGRQSVSARVVAPERVQSASREAGWPAPSYPRPPPPSAPLSRAYTHFAHRHPSPNASKRYTQPPRPSSQRAGYVPVPFLAKPHPPAISALRRRGRSSPPCLAPASIPLPLAVPAYRAHSAYRAARSTFFCALSSTPIRASSTCFSSAWRATSSALVRDALSSAGMARSWSNRLYGRHDEKLLGAVACCA